MRFPPTQATPYLGYDTAPYFPAGLGRPWRWHPRAPRLACCGGARGGFPPFGWGGLNTAAAGPGTRERWVGVPWERRPLLSPHPLTGRYSRGLGLPPTTGDASLGRPLPLPQAVLIRGMPLVCEVGIKTCSHLGWTRGPPGPTAGGAFPETCRELGDPWGAASPPRTPAEKSPRGRE